MVTSAKTGYINIAGSSFTRGIIPFVFLCLPLAGCSLLIPSNKSLETDLKTAETDFKQAETSNKLDLRAIVEKYRSASERTEKALAVLAPILAKPEGEPDVVDKLQKLKDASYELPRKRQVSLNKSFLNLKAQIDKKLPSAQAKLDKVIHEMARLLEQNRNKLGTTDKELAAIYPYAPYIKEVKDAKLEIDQLTIKHLEVTGLAQVEAKKYPAAEQSFKHMGAIPGGSDQAKAGMHAVAAHKAFMKKSYEAAFDELLEIRSIHPESAFLKNYYDKTQLLSVKAKLAVVDALAAKGSFAGLIDGFEKLDKLVKTSSKVASLTDEVAQRKKILRQKVAAEYIHRASKLKQQDEILYASLILRNLRLAHQFDPDQVRKYEADANKAYGLMARKADMKVLVAFNGSGGLSTEWGKRLESDLMFAVERSGIPGVTVADKARMKAGGSDLAMTDLVIKGGVDSVTTGETGRNSPARYSSKYVSSTRQVPNPQYPVAWDECRSAEARYNALYQESQRLKRDCNNLSGYAAQTICRGAISYLSTTTKDQACGRAQSTPRELTEKILSSYQYDKYVVSVNVSVRGKCGLVDNLSRLEAKCTAINENTKSEGAIIAHAQATDTEGIQDGENVPRMEDVKAATYSKISGAVSAELIQNIAAFRAQRYCKLAGSLGNSLIASEAYSMCDFLTENDTQKRPAALNAKLNAYASISPEQAQAFGLESNDAAAAWPAPSRATVDDKELRKAMVRQRAR